MCYFTLQSDPVPQEDEALCDVVLCAACRVILSPKKMKHSVINISLALVLLLAGFVLGINRTDMQVPCQVTGICLHYFTLAATFWITITSK